MSVLAIAAGATGVTALVVSPRGQALAQCFEPFSHHLPGPGRMEHAPEEIWQATLAASREVVTRVDATELTAVGVTNQRETVVLWDRETLGSPRRAIGGRDRRTTEICTGLRDLGHDTRVRELTGLDLDPRLAATKLAWMAEHEPHTWALVESGRYAVGTLDSYLVARMTRGTWHVTDVANAARTLLFDRDAGVWSTELCRLFGVPGDALPDVVPSWGELARTEPSVFAGLSLPIAGVAADEHAALFGQARLEAGDTRCSYASEPLLLVNAGTTVRGEGPGVITAAWRSPGGITTYAREVSLPPPSESVVREVRGAVETLSPMSVVRVDGPAAADDALCQLQADVLELAVERPAVLATSALGAAFLAGLGTGVWDSDEALLGAWPLGQRFEPA